MTQKIHFITFYTNKYPALDLSQEQSLLKQTVSNNYDSYTAFNPDIIDNKYTKHYPKLNIKEHSRGCFHGFWAWKPHIILKRILSEDVESGDIVIYSDCNITRYSSRVDDLLTIKQTAQKLFNHIGCDFLISRDHNNLKIKHHVKLETFKYIVGKKHYQLMNGPLLHANRVFVRKSQLSIDILQRWQDLCLKENLLLPTIPEMAPLRWHTHDQAIITSLGQKLILDKILPDHWPGFTYDYNLLIPEKKIIFHVRNIKNNKFYYDK